MIRPGDLTDLGGITASVCSGCVGWQSGAGASRITVPTVRVLRPVLFPLSLGEVRCRSHLHLAPATGTSTGGFTFRKPTRSVLTEDIQTSAKGVVDGPTPLALG